MKQSEKIRIYALDKHIKPARKNGKRIVKIRSGDVHDKMGLINRAPAVCSVLDTKIFLEFAKVNLKNREPEYESQKHGKYIYYTFTLDG